MSDKLSEENLLFINKAIEESNKSDGGPFGAIIVKDNKIISYGNNKVTVLNDPTAHAEIVAIREACKLSENFSLEGCTLYTSCEPCPMCLSAIYWARIKDVYYANTREDAASIDFDDKEIYEEIKKDIDDRKIKMTRIYTTDAFKTFINWKNNSCKIKY
jgi:tRNA(Arg) A34 adenosine deaminase TadA